jgi:hypothetical protein
LRASGSAPSCRRSWRSAGRTVWAGSTVVSHSVGCCISASNSAPEQDHRDGEPDRSALSGRTVRHAGRRQDLVRPAGARPGQGHLRGDVWLKPRRHLAGLRSRSGPMAPGVPPRRLRDPGKFVARCTWLKGPARAGPFFFSAADHGGRSACERPRSGLDRRALSGSSQDGGKTWSAVTFPGQGHLRRDVRLSGR